VRKVLERGGFLDLIGRDQRFDTKDEAIRAIYARLGTRPQVRAVCICHGRQMLPRSAWRCCQDGSRMTSGVGPLSAAGLVVVRTTLQQAAKF
jgi:hypothetical protein